MLRWKYILPRLCIVLVTVFTIWLVKDTAIRWSLMRGGQTLTGAKVEIASLQTALTTAKVKLTGVQIADPQNPEYNLFQADRGELDLDLSQLLKRRFIIEQLTIDSARFNSSRSTSGDGDGSGLIRLDGSFGLPDVSQLPSGIRDIDQVLVTSVADQFETHRVARELIDRWPRRFETLESQVASVESRVTRLTNTANQSHANPLRNFEIYRQAYQDLTAIQGEIQLIYRHLDEISNQVPVDRQALQTARQHDEEKLRNLTRVSTMNSQEAAEFILGAEQVNTLNEIVKWVRWAQSIAPDPEEVLEPERRKGIDIRNFAGRRSQPDFVVRRLNLTAHGRLDDDDYQIAGQLQNITTNPKALGQPILMNLNLEGPSQLNITGTLDRTESIPHDQFVIAVPGLETPARTIGSRDSIALKTAAGAATIRVNVDLVGENLTGSITYRRDRPGLDVEQVAERLGGMETHIMLGTALGQIRSIEFSMELRGTLDAPKVAMRSNLGPQVADAFNAALSSAVERQSERLAARVQQEFDQDWLQLTQVVDGHRNAILGKLEANNVQLNRLRNQLANSLGVQILR